MFNIPQTRVEVAKHPIIDAHAQQVRSHGWFVVQTAACQYMRAV
jgi:hypothetical protein